jgi:hypothetical protein
VKYYTSGEFNRTPEYKMTTPMVLSPGTYYIGIQQYVASGLTVGFDKNLDHSSSLFFDSGNGWSQSAIYGSLMIRPVFGKVIPPAVGIRELTNMGVEFANVYPNPANESLVIHLKENHKITYRIVNALGETVEHANLTETVSHVNTSQLANGVYFIELSNKQQVQRKKIIIQH